VTPRGNIAEVGATNGAAAMAVVPTPCRSPILKWLSAGAGAVSGVTAMAAPTGEATAAVSVNPHHRLHHLHRRNQMSPRPVPHLLSDRNGLHPRRAGAGMTASESASGKEKRPCRGAWHGR
jgi:hypothetical protein